jgi:hypothetical protein
MLVEINATPSIDEICESCDGVSASTFPFTGLIFKSA